MSGVALGAERQRPSPCPRPSTGADADARRDLAEQATTDAVTARVTYGLVFGGQCATAAWIGQILQRNGWAGEPTRCPLCPALGAPGAR